MAIPAVSRLTPPGPIDVIRRLCVISAKGFVWSMYWERGLDPKNSRKAPFKGFVVTKP